LHSKGNVCTSDLLPAEEREAKKQQKRSCRANKSGKCEPVFYFKSYEEMEGESKKKDEGKGGTNVEKASTSATTRSPKVKQQEGGVLLARNRAGAILGLNAQKGRKKELNIRSGLEGRRL